VEVQWRRKDGRIIIVRLSGCAATASDEPEEVLELMAEDITDRRQLEEQLRRRKRWMRWAGWPAASRTTSTTC